MKLNTNIQSINALRGIAAIMVTLFHFSKGFLDENSVVQKTLSYGWTGVEIFFVISGFVITWSMINSDYKFRNLKTFLYKRFIRIEPPYIISAIVIIILNYLSSLSSSFQGKAFVFDPYSIILHMGYLVRLFEESWINPVYWSLEVEFHFYFLMALSMPLLLSKKSIIQVFALLMLSTLIFLKNNITPLFDYIDIFLLGILIALYKSKNINNITFWISIAIMSTSVFINHELIICFVTIISSAIILFQENLFNHSIFSFFGKISYSLYLLHVPFGGRIINISKRFDLNELNKFIVLLFALTFSIGISFLFYWIIEKPFHKMAKRIIYSK